jgi:hypothetical protein
VADDASQKDELEELVRDASENEALESTLDVPSVALDSAALPDGGESDQDEQMVDAAPLAPQKSPKSPVHSVSTIKPTSPERSPDRSTKSASPERSKSPVKSEPKIPERSVSPKPVAMRSLSPPQRQTSPLRKAVQIKDDVVAMDVSLSEPQSVEIPENATTTLEVRNLVRPFTVQALKSRLGSFGAVSFFWIDSIRSHCFVSVWLSFQ